MRLALFDLDETLVDRSEVVRRLNAHIAAHHGIDPAETAAVMATEDLLPWPERMAKLRARFDLTDSVDELLAEHQREFLAGYRPAPATLEALAALRDAGWRIGIVTNGRPFQEDKVRASGLDHFVDGYVVSDLIGARKPSPVIFAAAAAACGCGGTDGWAAALEAGWMVGDSLTADIAGARTVGLRSAWLHLGRRFEDVAAQPDPYAIRAGEPALEPADLRPDHIVDNVAAAVSLMLS